MTRNHSLNGGGSCSIVILCLRQKLTKEFTSKASTKHSAKTGVLAESAIGVIYLQQFMYSSF
jgi:hypothetical protein